MVFLVGWFHGIVGGLATLSGVGVSGGCLLLVWCGYCLWFSSGCWLLFGRVDLIGFVAVVHGCACLRDLLGLVFC